MPPPAGRDRSFSAHPAARRPSALRAETPTMKKLVPRAFERERHLEEATFQAPSRRLAGRGRLIDLSATGARLFTTASIAVGDDADLAWDKADARRLKH
jgi:hypothetical protein